ncbi:hypothetical protein CFP56_009851 [Quercus suber]|uniref:Uncharacterized protein n=1 Tax=Quercus suber TaxID=58331 RepID=A0AAW0L2R7_QUESU
MENAEFQSFQLLLHGRKCCCLQVLNNLLSHRYCLELCEVEKMVPWRRVLGSKKTIPRESLNSKAALVA